MEDDDEFTREKKIATILCRLNDLKTTLKPVAATFWKERHENKFKNFSKQNKLWYKTIHIIWTTHPRRQHQHHHHGPGKAQTDDQRRQRQRERRQTAAARHLRRHDQRRHFKRHKTSAVDADVTRYRGDDVVGAAPTRINSTWTPDVSDTPSEATQAARLCTHGSLRGLIDRSDEAQAERRRPI